MNRQVILYIATGLDGYIAKPKDDLDFLSIVEQEGQDYGYADFVKSVDAVIVGRKTYGKVISMGFKLSTRRQRHLHHYKNGKTKYWFSKISHRRKNLWTKVLPNIRTGGLLN